MDLSLNPEYVALRQMFREFAEQEVRPLVAKAEQEGYPQREVLKKAAEAGLLGVPFPKEYGGMGAGETGYCILMEELSRVDTSICVTIGAHIGIGAMAIYVSGSDKLKKKYLTPLCRGEMVAAFCLTEPNAGSDAASIKTRAVREGDSYFLDGQKIWISNGPNADIYSVLAITDPALGARGGATCFVVERNSEGIKVGKPERKMGLHASPTSVVAFDSVRVPQENIIGDIGLGFITFMKTLDVGRVTLGAGTLGGAQAALEASLRWAKAREQFGQPIAHKQSIQFMIADMATEIEALRALVYKTAWLVDTGRPFTREAGMCKLMGSEVGSRCIDRALQIHGALGYSQDFQIEKGYRDSRITEIFEGTNEIQRIVIASELFQEVGIRLRP